MKALLFHSQENIYLVQLTSPLAAEEVSKLEWLLEARLLPEESVSGRFIGPRREMVTPWSTNATEIARNVGVKQVHRIEVFQPANRAFDRMLEAEYAVLNSETLQIDQQPVPGFTVENIAEFNRREGLALSDEEIAFLEDASEKLGRRFTDTELFAFGQINSEHCRHKIFRGTFIIDGEEKPSSLFDLIRRTSEHAPENIVSAYKDNVAFIRGPKISPFAPERGEVPSDFGIKEIPSVLSLKAETHNFPTTVEPFYGASTGSGGEIRDRMAGGRGSIPLTGTAVYMTAYPRLHGASLKKRFEESLAPRRWKYQTPEEILVKASNGASDFGNKFGQPLTVGSLFTYEMNTEHGAYAYDRVVMLAGGVGYAHADQAAKGQLEKGDVVVVLGGDNYRIGMAGGSVSSVNSGEYAEALELSAVQRANPEMQKRVYNVIRSLTEATKNPIVMIHDHGAGGHVNCLSEILEASGGKIFIRELPVGDPTLSVREILCNESQERMGLAVKQEDVPLLQAIAERERAQMYVVGEITDDHVIRFVERDGSAPFELPTSVLFGSSPKTVLEDRTPAPLSEPGAPKFASGGELLEAVKQVLSLEGVACKDWLTNKVDRSVTGLVALQQCVGPYQLPLSNLSVTALDFTSEAGIATSLGHAAGVGVIDGARGGELSVIEALTNIVWAPLEKGLRSVVLSANWMWPAKRPGENAKLYAAVEALSNLCCALGIAVPTGKDSLSMTMKYGDGLEVRAPGTVVVTAVAHCEQFRKTVTPFLRDEPSELFYLDLSGGAGDFPLGGSSYQQTVGRTGGAVPQVDPQYFAAMFEVLQKLVREELLLSGHDVSSGGLITTVCEMCFGGKLGCALELSGDVPSMLLSEKPGVVLQLSDGVRERVLQEIARAGGRVVRLGRVGGEKIAVAARSSDGVDLSFGVSVEELFRVWFEPSYLLDTKQTGPEKAKERFDSVFVRRVESRFPEGFTGKAGDYGITLGRRAPSGLRAAIVRDKGTNGDRELAYVLYAAGFDVKDVTMSDLVSGRETLKDVRLVAFPGGFSNSDVLGAGRGWAGVFKYNDRAMRALRDFYSRPDTLSVGVCNGCQLVAAMQLIDPEHDEKLTMNHNVQGKFESGFVEVEVGVTNSVFFQGLEGMRLGVWVAHGEGRFSLPAGERGYDIPLRYVHSVFPGNPNGADFNAAGVSSRDGRHLAVMPHMERTVLPWHWGYYPESRRKTDEISPWFLPFVQARNWLRR